MLQPGTRRQPAQPGRPVTQHPRHRADTDAATRTFGPSSARSRQPQGGHRHGAAAYQAAAPTFIIGTIKRHEQVKPWASCAPFNSVGTRFYPIAKTINKCMLPVLDQPVLAYAVANCVAARAAEIAIVTAPGEAGRQVRHYFTEDRGLAAYFAARGWHDRYEPIAHLHDQAGFTFIQQPRDTSRYGTTLPAILAAGLIGATTSS